MKPALHCFEYFPLLLVSFLRNRSLPFLVIDRVPLKVPLDLWRCRRAISLLVLVFIRLEVKIEKVLDMLLRKSSCLTSGEKRCLLQVDC